MNTSQSDTGSKTEGPLVSICIPTYNSEKYIGEMLSTIERQTYQNIEVIISDNNSTDNTFSIIESYASRLNWKLIKNELNIGALNNMTVLIKEAKGKYVALYHADDLYANNIVQKSVDVLETNVSVGMVSTMGFSIDSKGNTLSRFNIPNSFKHKNVLSFEDVFLEILSQRPFFLITPSVMARASFYDSNPYFNSRYRSAADYGKWFEILQTSKLCIVNDELIRYRTHEQQGSQLEIKDNYRIPDSIPLYRDYASTRPSLYWNGFRHSYYKMMSVQAVKLNNIGHFRKSQQFLKLVLRYGPKSKIPIVWVIQFCNYFKIKFDLNKLISFKKTIKFI